MLEGQTLYGKGVMQLDGVQGIQVQPLPLQQGLRGGQCAGQRVVRIGAQAEPAQPVGGGRDAMPGAEFCRGHEHECGTIGLRGDGQTAESAVRGRCGRAVGIGGCACRYRHP